MLRNNKTRVLAQEVGEGGRVWTRLPEGVYSPGVVTQIETKLQIRLDEGDLVTCNGCDVTSFVPDIKPHPAHIRHGARVLLPLDSRYCGQCGTVIAVDHGTDGSFFLVQMDYGEEVWEAASSLRLLGGSYSKRKGANLQLGEEVLAKWWNGVYYQGNVTGIGAMLEITFHNGDIITRHPLDQTSAVRDSTPDPQIVRRGARVIAQLLEEPGYYPGTIIKADSPRYLVLFDIGEEEWKRTDEFRVLVIFPSALNQGESTRNEAIHEDIMSELNRICAELDRSDRHLVGSELDFSGNTREEPFYGVKSDNAREEESFYRVKSGNAREEEPFYGVKSDNAREEESFYGVKSGIDREESFFGVKSDNARKEELLPAPKKPHSIFDSGHRDQCVPDQNTKDYFFSAKRDSLDSSRALSEDDNLSLFQNTVCLPSKLKDYLNEEGNEKQSEYNERNDNIPKLSVRNISTPVESVHPRLLGFYERSTTITAEPPLSVYEEILAADSPDVCYPKQRPCSEDWNESDSNQSWHSAYEPANNADNLFQSLESYHSAAGSFQDVFDISENISSIAKTESEWTATGVDEELNSPKSPSFVSLEGQLALWEISDESSSDDMMDKIPQTGQITKIIEKETTVETIVYIEQSRRQNKQNNNKQKQNTRRNKDELQEQGDSSTRGAKLKEQNNYDCETQERVKIDEQNELSTEDDINSASADEHCHEAKINLTEYIDGFVNIDSTSEESDTTIVAREPANRLKLGQLRSFVNKIPQMENKLDNSFEFEEWVVVCMDKTDFELSEARRAKITRSIYRQLEPDCCLIM